MLIDAGIGLEQPNVPGDYGPVKPLQKIKSLLRRGEGFGRPVTERINWHVAGTQLAEKIDCPLDGSSEHLVIPLHPCVDHSGMRRMFCFQRGACVGKGASAI